MLDDMSKDRIIRDCLLINKAEVTLMLLTEYNEEETMQMFKEEGREEGILEGRQQGRFQLIVDLVNDKILSLEEAATRADMTVEEFKKRIEK
jgi:predicted transposase YdaD